MDAIEFIIYTILIFVIIAFIGVIGYIIYDNYTYKKDLKLDLNTNFKDINNNFDSTSNIINKLHGNQTNNLNMVSDKVDNFNKLFTSNISNLNLKYDANNNIFSNNISDINYKLTDNSKIFSSNIGTFSDNLNKYFSFNINDNGKYGDPNKKIFEYRTAGSDTNKLNLITKTTATAGLKINSDSNAELEICNKTGTNCYNISSDDSNLYIYKNGGGANIYIGGDGKTPNAPFKIVNGVASITNANVNVNAGLISALAVSKSADILFISGGKGYTGHSLNPPLTITGGGSTSLQIGNFTYSDDEGRIISATITNHGNAYTSVPTITIPEPPARKPVLFTATPTATPAVNTVPSTGALTQTLPVVSSSTLDNGYYKKGNTIVTITNNSRKAGAIAQTDSNANITSITIKNIVNGATDNSLPLDNGFYFDANVRIISINGISVSTSLTFTKTIVDGVLMTITPTITGGVWGGFAAASQNNLTVVLSDPETPVSATIIPEIQNGTIKSLTLQAAGSKYYKPTININDAQIVSPQPATFPTLFKL